MIATALVAGLFSAIACTDINSAPPETSVSSSVTELPPGEYHYPVNEAGPYTFVWSAARGIDVHSRAAELARAYIESCQLSVFGGDAVYPGAADAAPPGTTDDVPSCLTPTKRPNGSTPAYYGTVYAHVFELDSTDTSVTARVCYTANGRAEVETGEPELDGLDAVETQFSASLPAGERDPRADVDRTPTPGNGERAPRFDVFYPWKFDPKPWSGATTANRAPRPSDDQCVRWSAENLSRIPSYSGQDPFTPEGYFAQLTPKLSGEKGFPTLPQTPAWPAR